VEVNAQGLIGETALHLAMQARVPKVVALLLESGAKADIVTHAKQTPLHQAVVYVACYGFYMREMDKAKGGHQSPYQLRDLIRS
jgi:hypothetical protein